MSILKMGLNEVARMKLACAIRATIKHSAKVVFRVMREMKNGCLWVLYTIDGIKCSTFVKSASFEKCLQQAEVNEIYINYVAQLASKYNVVAKLEKGIVEIVKTTPSRIKDIITKYQAILDESTGQFRLYIDTRKGLTVVSKFTLLADLFAHIAK